MSHLDAAEYQGLGASQMHDAAIDAGLVERPERAMTDDERQQQHVEHVHSLHQFALESATLGQLEELDEDPDLELDAALLDSLRRSRLAALERQDAPVRTGAGRASLARDINEAEFQSQVVDASAHGWCLLLLHRRSQQCQHASECYDALSLLHPTVKMLRMVVREGLIARFPLSACPTVLAYHHGVKRHQWDSRAMGGAKADVSDWEEVLVEADIVR